MKHTRSCQNRSGRCAALLAVALAMVAAMSGCAGLQELEEVGSGAGPAVSSMSATPEAAATPSATPPAPPTVAGAMTADAERSVMADKDAPGPMKAPVPAGRESMSGMPDLPGRYAESGKPSAPSESGLKAGFSDDNKQYNYFVAFLEEYSGVPHVPFSVAERINLVITDSSGKPVPDALVSIDGKVAGLTKADGTFRLYPGQEYPSDSSWTVEVSAGKLRLRTTVSRHGPRTVSMVLGGARTIPAPLPLDILFVMDTTGSMGEEIARLKSTMEIIHANVSSLRPKPDVRFGLVLYKDRGDEYITQTVPFTRSLEEFRAALEPVTADGGGDGPEDLESALDVAVREMDWTPKGLRLAFVITDAEAHLDYGHRFSYIDAAREARVKGIRIHTIGTGGLPIEGEYLLRQVSQLTDGKYIFLTYGEGGESDGGAPGSVSHHTGSNFQTDKLEVIIIRFVRDDVALLSDLPVTIDDEYFSAKKVDSESRDQTLDTLFDDALGNLADYSSFRLTRETRCAVVPVTVGGGAGIAAGAAAGSAAGTASGSAVQAAPQAPPGGQGLAATAEYFGERLAMAAASADRWTAVERKDLQKVLDEMELQLSGGVGQEGAARIGYLLGADVLIVPTLYAKSGSYEMLLKLIRVETGEILSVARAVIDPGLGL